MDAKKFVSVTRDDEDLDVRIDQGEGRYWSVSSHSWLYVSMRLSDWKVIAAELNAAIKAAEIAALPKTEVFDIALTVRPAAELCHEHGLPIGQCECPSEFAAATAELGGEG